jgi:predicted TIM-barrel fold metal-dependent hydrolase
VPADVMGSGIVDVNAVIPSGLDGAGRLARERERIGVASALARHADAVAADPVVGTRRAIEAAEDASLGILAIAVVTPSTERAVASVPEIARAGVRGFWLGADSWYGRAATPSAATAELVDAVARTGLPLLVPIAEWGDATAIGRLTEGLGVAVILVGAHYTHIADDLAAANRYPQLHLETSGLAHLGAIERVVAAVGAERLLFGSGMPQRPPSAPLEAVVAARIGDADRRAILGGNAQRLFGLPMTPVELPRPLDATAPAERIDVHGHLPPVPWDVPDLDASGLAGAQADRGVSHTVVSSLEAITGHAPTGNAATVAACAQVPGLLGYLVADPNDLDGTADQLRRHGDAQGIVGAKVHCEWSGCDTASSEIAALFELLATHGRPVLIHVSGTGWPDAMRRLVREHPSLPVIAAHGGPGAPSPAMAEVARDCDNLRLELASSFASLPDVRRMVEVAGAERFVFGTDVPLLDPAFVLGTYADAGLTPGATPGVFRDQAAAILGLGA